MAKTYSYEIAEGVRFFPAPPDVKEAHNEISREINFDDTIKLLYGGKDLAEEYEDFDPA